MKTNGPAAKMETANMKIVMKKTVNEVKVDFGRGVIDQNLNALATKRVIIEGFQSINSKEPANRGIRVSVQDDVFHA
jgi:hypothetical protein